MHTRSYRKSFIISRPQPTKLLRTPISKSSLFICKFSGALKEKITTAEYIRFMKTLCIILGGKKFNVTNFFLKFVNAFGKFVFSCVQKILLGLFFR